MRRLTAAALVVLLAGLAGVAGCRAPAPETKPPEPPTTPEAAALTRESSAYAGGLDLPPLGGWMHQRLGPFPDPWHWALIAPDGDRAVLTYYESEAGATTAWLLLLERTGGPWRGEVERLPGNARVLGWVTSRDGAAGGWVPALLSRGGPDEPWSLRTFWSPGTGDDGTPLPELSGPGLTGPTGVAPGGRWVYALGGERLMVIATATREIRSVATGLPTPASGAVPSPDGERLLLLAESGDPAAPSGLLLVELATGATTRLDDGLTRYAGPTWRPDGEQLAVGAGERHDGRFRVYQGMTDWLLADEVRVYGADGHLATRVPAGRGRGWTGWQWDPTGWWLLLTGVQVTDRVRPDGLPEIESPEWVVLAAPNRGPGDAGRGDGGGPGDGLLRPRLRIPVGAPASDARFGPRGETLYLWREGGGQGPRLDILDLDGHVLATVEGVAPLQPGEEWAVPTIGDGLLYQRREPTGERGGLVWIAPDGTHEAVAFEGIIERVVEDAGGVGLLARTPLGLVLHLFTPPGP